ncbi:UDP-galactose transporter [Coemansia sp. IMI 209127]|nr:UDP-galactose transporter [Coemansia sp. IMI 209127]
MGQCFVFYTLAKFGSLTLTTVTVTRKFLTILISVFYNGHKLNSRQWSSTGLVFAGITLDVYKKQTSKKAKNGTPLAVHSASSKTVGQSPTSERADASSAQQKTPSSRGGSARRGSMPDRIDGSMALDNDVRRRRLVDVAAS